MGFAASGGDVIPWSYAVGLRPCQFCHRIFRGAAKHAYPALVDGSDVLRVHHYLCPQCLERWKEWIDAHLERASEDGTYEESDYERCAVCGQSPDQSHAMLFITMYPDPDNRTDYFGRLCEAAACRVAAIAQLGI